MFQKIKFKIESMYINKEILEDSELQGSFGQLLNGVLNNIGKLYKYCRDDSSCILWRG